MIQISHILVLSQPEFVERQIGSFLTGRSAGIRLRSRVAAWLGGTAAALN